jgi:hypothetical protein
MEPKWAMLRGIPYIYAASQQRGSAEGGGLTNDDGRGACGWCRWIGVWWVWHPKFQTKI